MEVIQGGSPGDGAELGDPISAHSAVFLLLGAAHASGATAIWMLGAILSLHPAGAFFGDGAWQLNLCWGTWV